MRRAALLGLSALAACAALGATWIARDALAPVAVRVMGQALTAVGQATTATAFAQEVLEFEPVPPESARALERDRARRRAARASAAPAPVVPPAAPAPPDVDVRVGSGSGDMMRIGQDIHIREGERVVGDVVAMGGDIVVDGHVEGDVQAMGGDVYLNSTARVDGDVFCMAGTLHEEAGAHVGGQRITALGPRDGRWSPRTVRLRHDDDEDWQGGRVFVSLLLGLIGLGVAWGFARLAPGRTGAALRRFREEPGQSLLVGMVTALVWAPGFIAVALLAALLCITLIGIPVAIVVLLAYPSALAVLWVWGFAVGAAALGGRVAAARRQTASPTPAPAPTLSTVAVYGALVLGGALLLGAILRSVPYLGPLHALGTLVRIVLWITVGVLSTIGAGALLRHEFSQGTLARWWSGRRTPDAAPAAAPATPAAPAPAPPADPAPPSAYMPPAPPAPPGPPPAEPTGPA
jgi:hypothetical protein